VATVKTALSIDESLFEQAEALAKELEVSRSRLFSMALEEFLRRHEAKETLAQINAVYSEFPPEDEEHRARKRQRHRELVEGTW
jgi:metal-responsive CopG/Arc/MetJ family transcriptional regulator